MSAQVFPVLDRLAQRSGIGTAEAVLAHVERATLGALHEPEPAALVACWLVTLAEDAQHDGRHEIVAALRSLAAVYARTYLADRASRDVHAPDDVASIEP